MVFWRMVHIWRLVIYMNAMMRRIMLVDILELVETEVYFQCGK